MARPIGSVEAARSQGVDVSRTEALQTIADWLKPTLGPSVAIERDWREWVTLLFRRYVTDAVGELIPFAAHHEAFWNWVWSIKVGEKPAPFVGIWPRGGAKSTSAEIATVALGAKRVRRYALYISATQEQADDHISNIAALLETPEVGLYYPALAKRLIGKYGNSKGWRRNRVRCSSGFTADAIGLDTAARGVKLEEARPDLIILDDLDEELDGPTTTDKKITVLVRKLLPAGSSDSAILAIQNLIIPQGIFSRLASQPGAPKADFLQGRIVSGPHKAVENAEVVVKDGRFTLVGGTPSWAGQSLERNQSMIDEFGYTAWNAECQHEVEDPLGGMFDHIDFESIRVEASDVPELVRVAVWIDPAVTSNDKSDSVGIQVDGLAVDGKIYRLWSWEDRTSPVDALERAITKALEYGADRIGVETDQGGDVWEVAYDKVWDELIANGTVKDTATKPAFVAEKAGAGFGPKAHRASRMLVDYERGAFCHVIGTNMTLERALRRFPLRKPFDLVDAAFWSWNDLTNSSLSGIGATDDGEFSSATVGRGRRGRINDWGSRPTIVGIAGGGLWRRVS